MRLPFTFAFLAGCLAVVVACSDDPPAGGGSTSSSGGSSGGLDAGGTSNEDASVGEDAGTSSGSTPTKATSVEVKLNDVVRTIHRAQFGITKADDTLYVEAHEGGVEACPEEETPNRTLIVRDVPKGPAGAQFTKDDGIFVTLLDFAGDQIQGPKPTTTATALTVTVVAIEEGAFVELDVDATFPEGTVKGRIYATYCAGMDEG